MRRSVNVGPVFASWGDDIHTDDTAFYGVGVQLTSFRWVFFGLSLDSVQQSHRNERLRLWQALETLVHRGVLDDADVTDALKR